MQNFIQKWSRFVVERRVLVLILAVASLSLALLPLKGLYFDNSNEMWFVQGDPALVQYDELTERFGDNEYLLVGLAARNQDKDIFTKEAFEILYKLTEYLEDHESISKVQSLTKYQRTVAVDGMMDVENLVPEYLDEWEATPANLDRARNIMAQETLMHGILITEDFRHTNISARTVTLPKSIDHHVKLMEDMRAFIAQEKLESSGFKIRLTGTPAINEAFFVASMEDSSLSMPLMLLLIMAFLVFSFRTIGGLVLPLIVVIGSVIYAMALIGISGWALNMLNVTLPIILMAVGIGDSVHLLSEFYHFRSKGLNPKEAAIRSAEVLFIPCLNTSITTSLGFLAISVSKLQPLSEFGLVAAAGVFFAFLLSLTVMPALLSFSTGKEDKAKLIAEDGQVARLTKNLTDHVYRYRIAIVAIMFLLGGTALWFTQFIRVDSNFINFFQKEHPVRQDMDYFADQFGGGVFLEIIVDTGRADSPEKSGAALEPIVLKQVLDLQNWLDLQPEAGRSNSIVDMVRKMNQTMHDDDAKYYKVPKSRELVAQYLLLYSNAGPSEDLSDIKSFDQRYLRISQRMENMSSGDMKLYMDRVKEHLRTNYQGLQIHLTGMPVLFNNMDVYILEGIVDSMLLAIGSIVICFLVLLRSIKYGLLALVPSLYPILLAAGIMGAFDFEMNFTTMIIAAITFGIAVDDAIHILTRYIRSRKSGQNRLEALRTSVSVTGRALVYTTMILYVGFSVLMLSSFVPNIQMGFFAGIILLMALIASLTILPAVMLLGGTGENKPKKESQ